MSRRFLLDNDGSNVFHGPAANLDREIAESVAECPANVTTYLLCAGAGTQYFKTAHGVVDPRTPLAQAHAAGKDPFAVFLAGLRTAGKETFATFRMNDVHNPEDEDQWNTPRIRREDPDCIVDPAAVRNGTADWMSYCLDYSRKKVRDYVLAVIRELVEGYQLDGLQLDWMRFPRHLSGAPEQVWEKREFITEFTAELRALCQKAGIKLAARVPTSLAGCRRLGMDLGAWTRQGLVDFIVPCPFLSTDFRMPLAEMRREMGNEPVDIYAGFDFGPAPQKHCPESLRGAASSLYDCGADGIYVFNFPCWQEYLAARPYHWLAGLETPVAAAAKPLLFSISHQLHRTPVDLPGILPLPLPSGETITMTLHVPQSALPAARALTLIHSGGDIRLRVNGEAAEELSARRRSEIFVEYTVQADPGSRPDREECRVFRFDPNSLKAGENILEIENLAGAALELNRVNLGLW